MIQSITTIPYSILNAGKNYGQTLVSSVMYAANAYHLLILTCFTYGFQVAVSKHLGLQTLRLASSPILPFNTTHYAYELESYLQR